MNEKALQALCDTWAQRAQAKFSSAKQEKDETGRRLIEHGALCYSNCAMDLRELLQAGNMSANLQLEEVEQNAERP